MYKLPCHFYLPKWLLCWASSFKCLWYLECITLEYNQTCWIFSFFLSLSIFHFCNHYQSGPWITLFWLLINTATLFSFLKQKHQSIKMFCIYVNIFTSLKKKKIVIKLKSPKCLVLVQHLSLDFQLFHTWKRWNCCSTFFPSPILLAFSQRDYQYSWKHWI